MADTTYSKGLEGVIAAESTICQIDGANGRLYYRGYPIEDLAQHSSFEETTYLLLYEELPSREELGRLHAADARQSGVATAGPGHDPAISRRPALRWSCCSRSSPI